MRFGVLFIREWQRFFKSPLEALLLLAFFFLALILFPFGQGFQPERLQAMGPGLVWVVALFAIFLSLERAFRPDFQDGSLESLLLSGPSSMEIVLAKFLAHWLQTVFPLLLLLPLSTALFYMPFDTVKFLALSLLFGTPALTSMGLTVSLLGLGARGSGLLSALLLFPLSVPLVIYGAGAVADAANGGDAWPELRLLLALSLFFTPLMVALSAFALKRLPS